MTKKALFLHWGPGSSTAIEQLWFGKELPIEWWDQPRFSKENPGAYVSLVEAAEKKLRTMASLQGGPVRVIGHSFGAQLAIELERRVPELIESITLLASSEWSPRAFENLAQHLSSIQANQERLEPVLSKCRQDASIEAFWALVYTVASIPDFMSHYWGPQSAQSQNRYSQYAQTVNTIDFDSLTAIMNGYLRENGFKGRKDGRVSDRAVRLVFGKHDPLIRVDEETQIWKKRFPNSKAESLDAGHFIHFEAEPSVWLGR